MRRGRQISKNANRQRRGERGVKEEGPFEGDNLHCQTTGVKTSRGGEEETKRTRVEEKDGR